MFRQQIEQFIRNNDYSGLKIFLSNNQVNKEDFNENDIKTCIDKIFNRIAFNIAEIEGTEDSINYNYYKAIGLYMGIYVNSDIENINFLLKYAIENEIKFNVEDKIFFNCIRKSHLPLQVLCFLDTNDPVIDDAIRIIMKMTSNLYYVDKRGKSLIDYAKNDNILNSLLEAADYTYEFVEEHIDKYKKECESRESHLKSIYEYANLTPTPQSYVSLYNHPDYINFQSKIQNLQNYLVNKERNPGICALINQVLNNQKNTENVNYIDLSTTKFTERELSGKDVRNLNQVCRSINKAATSYRERILQEEQNLKERSPWLICNIV